MATEHDSPKPVLVSVRDARRMLANMSHNRFWELAAQGEFEITGTKRKRQVFVRSLEAYAERQPRAEYSRPTAGAAARRPIQPRA
jgi:hypothetical protein